MGTFFDWQYDRMTLAARCHLHAVRRRLAQQPGDVRGCRWPISGPRNRVLYERVRDQGGVLYPVSALPMSSDDWQRHFGPAWTGFQDALRRYDPAGILTPGYL